MRQPIDLCNLISSSRDKRRQAITYFTTKLDLNPSPSLYRLLADLDFEHFAQTGRTVTGLSYVALAEGPTPLNLAELIDDLAFARNTAFDQDVFSSRELTLLALLATEQERFPGGNSQDSLAAASGSVKPANPARGNPGQEGTRASPRLPHDPWAISLGFGIGTQIDPMLALRNPGALSREFVVECQAQSELMNKLFCVD